MKIFAAMVMVLVGCASTPDYGAPDSTTRITLTDQGGFAPTEHSRVTITATTATYVKDSSTTAMVALAPAAVEGIVHDLEDADFLALHGDYSICANADSDNLTTVIDVALTAGSNTVTHYHGCHGGEFAALEALETKLYAASGFTTWVQTH